MSSRTGARRPAQKRVSGARKKNAQSTRKSARKKSLGLKPLKWSKSAIRSVLLATLGFRLAHRRRFRPDFCGSGRLLLFNPAFGGPTA